MNSRHPFKSRKASSIIAFLFVTLVVLSFAAGAALGTDSDAAHQWEKYYGNDRSTFYYDKKSVHHPYKDNSNIMAVTTKNVPSTYLTHDQDRIGYFSDLVYIDCEKSKYRRKEMLIYSDSGEILERQLGIPTYYTIDPESAPEALSRKVCP